MVREEGGVRFMDSYLWANIHDEVSRSVVLIIDETDVATRYEAPSHEGDCRHR